MESSGTHPKDVPPNTSYKENVRSEDAVDETRKDDREKARGAGYMEDSRPHVAE